jgi:hypothetical protein
MINGIKTDINMNREKIKMSSEQQKDLWNGVYHIGNNYQIDGETYTSVMKINTSDKSDGPSWDYIVQRKSDGLFFKFNVWDAGVHNGYLFEDDGLEQVFEKTTITYE